MKWCRKNLKLLVVFAVIGITFGGVIIDNQEEVKVKKEVPLEVVQVSEVKEVPLEVVQESEVKEELVEVLKETEVKDVPLDTLKEIEIPVIPVEVVEAAEIGNDTVRTLHKDKYNKKKPDNSDDNHHHHYQDRDKVVVQVKPTHPSYRPKCRDHSEEWSYSTDCDVQCDNQGILGHHDYHSSSYGIFRSAKSDHRCRRMVSDVLLEEGYKNISTRVDIGYPPEPKDEYLRRTKKNYNGHHSQGHHPEYVIVQSDDYHYQHPPGECVCKKGFARLRGICVPHSQCPQLNCHLDTQIYVACAPCPKTCLNLLTYDASTLGCVCSPRCACKYGLVLSPNGQCVNQALCAAFTQSTTTTTTTPTTTTTTTTTTPSTVSSTVPSSAVNGTFLDTEEK